MNRKAKLRKALEYQEQGYNFAEIAELIGYSNKYVLQTSVNVMGGKVVKGKIIIEIEEATPRDSNSFIGIEPCKKEIRICTNCHKEFKANVDKRGIAYETRCRSCKKVETQYRTF